MSNSACQGIYAPLPQSISDSDSEEELHSSLPAKFKDSSKHLNGAELRNYHNLNEEDNLNGFPNITSSMDDSPIIKDSYKKPMSPIRKFFFSLSILICFLTIVVFLWVLPCNEDATCPIMTPKLKISNWEKPYHGIELMGPINVVNGINGGKNLVFLFRGDVVNRNPVQGLQNIPPKGGGAISMMGDTGKVAWYAPRQRLPYEIDCTLLDVDNDGSSDCILSGAEGMLEVLDPISGSIIWCIHIHNSSNSIITSVEFPLLISDINNDKINDLLTSCSLNNSNHNILVIISGRVGNIVGQPYVVQACDSIANLEIEKNFLSFSCTVQNDVKKSFLPLHDFYTQVFGRNIKEGAILSRQHKKIKKHAGQRMIYSVNGRQLIVNNEGVCPKNCNVSVQLIDQRLNRGHVMYVYTGRSVYGMIPNSITFKNSENNLNSLQGHINGFTLKYWQYNDVKSENTYPQDYFNSEKLVKRNILTAWRYPTVKLLQKRNLPQNKNTTTSEQSLTERVSLITFNATNFNVVNASQSEVKQLCASSGEKMYCQPDLALQENSVLIADLDNDGSKELISYLTTFVSSDENDENNNVKYQLQSSVKVIRLESELPKLYEAVTKY